MRIGVFGDSELSEQIICMAGQVSELGLSDPLEVERVVSSSMEYLLPKMQDLDLVIIVTQVTVSHREVRHDTFSHSIAKHLVNAVASVSNIAVAAQATGTRLVLVSNPLVFWPREAPYPRLHAKGPTSADSLQIAWMEDVVLDTHSSPMILRAPFMFCLDDTRVNALHKRLRGEWDNPLYMSEHIMSVGYPSSVAAWVVFTSQIDWDRPLIDHGPSLTVSPYEVAKFLLKDDPDAMLIGVGDRKHSVILDSDPRRPETLWDGLAFYMR